MKRIHPLILIAGAMVVLLGFALLWLTLMGRAGGTHPGRRHLVEGTNPALDIRYSYDSSMFTPAPYDERSEFPLRLDAPDWSLYGKRIRGVGSMVDHTGAMLYDFVGSQEAEGFEQHFKLTPVGKPLYEDTKIHGELALHQQLIYSKPQGGKWPAFFPECMLSQAAGAADGAAGGGSGAAADLNEAAQVYIDGWAFFTKNDLFYFYAISPQPFEAGRTNLCTAFFESIQFDSVLGTQNRPTNLTPVPADQVPIPQTGTPDESAPPPANPPAAPGK